MAGWSLRNAEKRVGMGLLNHPKIELLKSLASFSSRFFLVVSINKEF